MAIRRIIIIKYYMIDLFLRAKHWQLFVMSYGVNVFCQLILVLYGSITESNLYSMEVVDGIDFMIAISIVFVYTISGWYWSVAIGLHKIIPNNVNINIKRFKYAFFISISLAIIIISISIRIANLSIQNTIDGVELSSSILNAIIIILFVLSIILIFCISYSIYFAAKIFKTAELQREVRFTDFAELALVFWFFPFIIWVVQPKINRMMESRVRAD